MANFVQLYKSTDSNAPVLTGQVNALIGVLNKCLVDGYTTASVSSLTQTGNVATATISSNATLVTGNYVTITGANESDYNGTFQITVLSSTQFTYNIANNPTSPATGTINYAKAGLQWTKPYTSTNAAVYRSADVNSNRFYLQVIDNGATTGGSKEAQIVGFESMVAFNTPSTTNPRQFPPVSVSASGLSVRKSTTADSTARAWTLIGDDRTFYFFCNTGDSAAFHQFGFGHFIPFRTGEGYNTFINGENAFNSAAAGNQLYASYAFSTSYQASLYAARPVTGLGTQAPLATLTLPYTGVNGSVWGSFSGMANPNGPDSGYYVMPLYLHENQIGAGYYDFRGRLPGMYVPMQANVIANYETITNITGLSGVTLTGLSCCNPVSTTVGLVLVDTFGPWN